MAESGLADSSVLDLRTVRDAGQLEPFLGEFGSPSAKRYASERLALALRDRGTLPNVGVLRSVRVSEEEMAQLDAPESLARALGTTLPGPIVSSERLATIKPSLVVRTPGDFRWRLALAAGLLVVSFLGASVALGRHSEEAARSPLLPLVALLCGVGLITMVGCEIHFAIN